MKDLNTFVRDGRSIEPVANINTCERTFKAANAILHVQNSCSIVDAQGVRFVCTSNETAQDQVPECSAAKLLVMSMQTTYLCAQIFAASCYS